MTEITEQLVFSILKPRNPDSHKGTYGTPLLICGSRCFPGAAALAVTSTLRCGAGIVRLASTRYVNQLVASKVSEPIYFELEEADDGAISGSSASDNPELEKTITNASACLIGCGLTQSPALLKLVKNVLYYAMSTVVLDADALNLLSTTGTVEKILGTADHPPILTPHIGEMSRLTGLAIAEIKQAPRDVAAKYAKLWNAVVVLKDHITHVALPDGRVYVNTTGNAGLARGGSGDTLSGMITSFVGQGYEVGDAAICAVWLHGKAADMCAKRLSKYGMLPSDILTDLCEIFRIHGL